MTTEDLMETFIQVAMKGYKKFCRNIDYGIHLDRHEPVIIDGVEFTSWREYTVYRLGEYINEKVPDCNVEVILDGNDSVIYVECTDEQQQRLNNKMYTFLKDIGVKL